MHRNTSGEEIRRFPRIRRMLKKPPALLVGMLFILISCSKCQTISLQNKQEILI